MPGLPLFFRGPRAPYYGWVIVAVCFLNNFIVIGVGAFAFALMMKPMGADLGWTRGMTTGALSMRNVLAGLIGPLLGTLLDRVGARPVMVVTALTGGLSLALISGVHSLWQFYLFYGVIGGMGGLQSSGLITSTLIAKWFIRKRGRAVAIASVGISLSGVFMIPVIQWLISSYGWRTTWLVMGILVWILVVIPSGLFLRRRPEDLGLRPDGDPAPDSEEHVEEAASLATLPRRPARMPVREETWTLRQALRTRTLWFLIAAQNLAGLGMGAIYLHEVAYLTDIGFSSAIAVTALTVHAASMSVGTVAGGFVSERLHVRINAMMSLIGLSVGVMLLILLGNVRAIPLVFVFAPVYGFFVGAQSVVSSLIWPNYYGRTFIGTISGFLNPLNLVSAAGGPLLAAFIHDVTGGYRPAFFIYIGCWLVASFLMFHARQPKKAELQRMAVPESAG
ncbi:MAG: MFS transporter [Chloroflexi bacterium]|nr:MFS transporter [Chloroflexota bacterium]